MAISQYDQLNYADYKPISMQEMWLPAQQMRQQHDQLQEEYAQQEQQGGLSLLGIDPVKDKAAYDIQQNFITKTKEAADQLATKGFIDSGRRRGLMEVKSLYTNQVVPLQNQLKIRQERAEELRKMQLQDPTFRATANPNDVDLMTGLKDPNAFNYDGVSGNQLYSTAAKKLEQLSKTINQDVPELKKMPKLSFQYFTAIQSGATPDQAANAMKREGYDPAVVDKMTNMIHGTIDSTMREFGVYDKFKGNDKAINELWDSTSQAAYNAIGTKQFGQVHDSWSEAQATKVLNTPPPEPPGKTHKEYDAAFDKKNMREYDDLLSGANAEVPSRIQPSNRSTDQLAPWALKYGSKDDKESSYGKVYQEWKNRNKESQNKINKIALDLQRKGLIKVPSRIAEKDLAEWNKSVIELAKEDFKTANLSRHFFNPSEETVKKFTATLSQMDEIKDVNGDKIDKSKIFSNTGKLIGDAYLVRGTNGTTLKTNDKDGNQISIPFNVEKLGSTRLAALDRDIRTLTNEQISRKYNQQGLTKEDLEDEVDRILTSEQYTETKSQNTNPGYTPYGTR